MSDVTRTRPSPFQNVERTREVAEEYRVAYKQLQHHEDRLARVVVDIERDIELARKRYEAARGAYLKMALEEEDEFLDDGAEVGATS